jgi:hypothetical protein
MSMIQWVIRFLAVEALAGSGLIVFALSESRSRRREISELEQALRRPEQDGGMSESWSSVEPTLPEAPRAT